LKQLISFINKVTLFLIFTIAMMKRNEIKSSQGDKATKHTN